MRRRSFSESKRNIKDDNNSKHSLIRNEPYVCIMTMSALVQ